jgi:cation:H+ antiporter
VLILLFVVFIYYLVSGCRNPDGQPESDPQDRARAAGLHRILLLVGAGLAGLVIGSRLVVNSAEEIALKLGVSDTLVGLTIVGAGTSMPELATSAVAAFRRNSDIAIGNVVGSNIFNIFFVLGATALIRPLKVDVRANADILVLVAASLLLFFFMFVGRRHLISRRKGIAFLAMYAAYLAFLLKRG